MTIYVGNLSFDAEVEDLQQLFSEYGEVRKCAVPVDRETGRKRGFAFVDMANAGDETKAINDLQDVVRNVSSLTAQGKEENVVTMPGESFGAGGAGHLRIALTVGVDEITEASKRIARLAERV